MSKSSATIWWRMNRLDVGLLSLFIASSYLMVASSSDPLIPSLRGTIAESMFSQFSTGNQIIFDSAVGFNVSILIYVLVVRLPEREKRKRVRRNLRFQFDAFKSECFQILLSALGSGYSPDEIDRLHDRTQFRQFFDEASYKPGQTRWHVVLNGLDEAHIRRLATEFEILIDEIRFTLAAIDVDDQDAFAMLKRLGHTLHRSKDLSSEYDDVKLLSSFLRSLFSDWNLIEGFTKKDAIAEMIESI
jgi:hypothetical protein